MAQSDTYIKRLLAAANTLDVALSVAQAHLLVLYVEQMQRWNRTYNLTAVRDPEQMLVHHVLDSLAVIEPVRDALATTSKTDSATIVDVGSGGGLPGVVMAALNPQWKVHCVDAVDKKMAFVRQMSGALKLPNLHAVHARIEALPAFEADIVVSRAFASLVDFATLAGPHVGAGAHLLAMKGRVPDEEMEVLERDTAWRVQRVQQIEVPGLDAQRCLVWMSCQGNP